MNAFELTRGSPAWAPLPTPRVSFAPRATPLAPSARCSVRDVLRWTGLEAWVGTVNDSDWLPTRRVQAEQALAHQHQSLTHFYVVGAGSFKLVKVDDEGFEQVLGFALRGDVIGLDGMNEQHHLCSVVALEDATVALLGCEDLLTPGRCQPALARLLHHAAATELQRRSDTQFLMAAASAEVRVARFLLSFGQRQQQLGCSASRFRLRMSRRDIASYLGVAHETVSRALTLLAQAGYMAVTQREIDILDVPGLVLMQKQSRGPSPCAALKRRGGA